MFRWCYLGCWKFYTNGSILGGIKQIQIGIYRFNFRVSNFKKLDMWCKSLLYISINFSIRIFISIYSIENQCHFHRRQQSICRNSSNAFVSTISLPSRNWILRLLLLFHPSLAPLHPTPRSSTEPPSPLLHSFPRGLRSLLGFLARKPIFMRPEIRLWGGTKRNATFARSNRLFSITDRACPLC